MGFGGLVVFGWVLLNIAGLRCYGFVVVCWFCGLLCRCGGCIDWLFGFVFNVGAGGLVWVV